MTQLRPCIVITSALLVLCCVLYPGVVTAGAQVLFKDQANGSLVLKDGKVVGSSLIGQSVADWAQHPE
jgi:potassium-transporting ATPase KdpC subunit